MEYPILAIDFGTKRIGLAISDSKGIVSTPIEPIRITKKMDETLLLQSFQAVVNENRIASFLIGMPQEFEESHKRSSKRIQKFIDWLIYNIPLPYKLWDESFSTSSAKDMIVSSGKRVESRKDRLDSIAASIFLQEFLNSKDNQKSHENY